MNLLAALLARFAIGALRLYRATLSYVVGPTCRYEPSCSHYAEEAIRGHGVTRGGALTVWRLLRCHPFARGGCDPVPPPRSSRASSNAPSRTPSGPRAARFRGW